MKSHSKNFFARMIPISITYIVLFSFTQIILKQVDKIGMKFEILIAGWKSYFFALL